MIRAHIVVGLAFGDEGKGSLVDYLVRLHNAAIVVRYNGGPQAGHNVVTADGNHHTFAQFGSGTFAGVKTHLSEFMLIELFTLMNEARSLADKLGGRNPLSLLTIDPLCRIITPYHWQLNRMREAARGVNRHGSCGMGVGELRASEERGAPVIRFRDLFDGQGVRAKLRTIRDMAQAEAAGQDSISRHYRGLILAEPMDEVVDFYRDFGRSVTALDGNGLKRVLRGGVSIFEGAQGVLLDEDYGFSPHNSWTKTTSENARMILDDTAVPYETIGVLRTHFTRHGPGPFISEWPIDAGDDFNLENRWQGKLRTGLFDAVAVKYALKVNGGINSIALTHLDKIGGSVRFVESYGGLGGNVKTLPLPCRASDLVGLKPVVTRYRSGWRDSIDIFERLIGSPVRYASWGRTADQKIDLSAQWKRAAQCSAES